MEHLESVRIFHMILLTRQWRWTTKTQCLQFKVKGVNCNFYSFNSLIGLVRELFLEKGLWINCFRSSFILNRYKLFWLLKLQVGIRNIKMIIILEKDKITEHVKHKLLKKGLSLVGMSDKEIIFNKLKHQFHWYFCFLSILLRREFRNEVTAKSRLAINKTNLILTHFVLCKWSKLCSKTINIRINGFHYDNYKDILPVV